MSGRPYRTRFGPHFSEGARLLWTRMARDSMSREALCAKVGCAKGSLLRWMYGDRLPARVEAGKIERALGIPPDAWDRKPSRAFDLPASARTGTEG